MVLLSVATPCSTRYILISVYSFFQKCAIRRGNPPSLFERSHHYTEAPLCSSSFFFFFSSSTTTTTTSTEHLSLSSPCNLSLSSLTAINHSLLRHGGQRGSIPATQHECNMASASRGCSHLPHSQGNAELKNLTEPSTAGNKDKALVKRQ